jgi:Carboxypeptidase regulatory-like domain
MRKINTLVIIVSTMASVCSFYGPALAQQSISSATLSGRLEDANGAAVSGAKITATNLNQNQSSTAASDAQGRFRFLYLPIGRYRLEVTATGFAPIERQLTLTVGQALDVPLKLTVGNFTDKVNITAGAPLVETVRTQVAETVLPQEIDSLPLNSRNYLDLAALTPGVTRGNPVANQRFAETSAVPGTQINVAGRRNIKNGFVIDGLSANDDAADLPGTFFSQEVIGEFQVITSGGIAEFGRASAGIVNVVTKSGTNDWRGRIYGFLSNQRLNARNPLAATKDPLTQTQYSASLGGPVQRDRTFLFANFE